MKFNAKESKSFVIKGSIAKFEVLICHLKKFKHKVLDNLLSIQKYGPRPIYHQSTYPAY
jgi:hypothetical protein